MLIVEDRAGSCAVGGIPSTNAISGAKDEGCVLQLLASAMDEAEALARAGRHEEIQDLELKYQDLGDSEEKEERK